ncbi:glycosyltransferase [Nocardia jejuensis]|uniref:glycosyltransferase n=1 Tax=Nocardia jejuensis TaxID=328049 RepID=UPI00082AC859|nr:glycosyltransferase [Nocardia jejuensis]
MRVLLAFAGSRGDAQPGVLLGRELARRGHRVILAVSPNLVKFATGQGVSAEPFGLDSDVLLRTQREDPRFGSLDPFARVRATLDLQRRGFREAARDLLALAPDADLLVTGMACEEIAAEVARARAVPLAAMHFFPILPNRAVPVVPTAWGRRLPGVVNRRGWQALNRARSWALASEIAALRAEAGTRTPERVHRPDPLGPVDPAAPQRIAVQAYDAELFPGLVDELAGAPVTGFPVVPDAGGTVQSELREWLIAGSAPIYVGFGSMPVTDPDALESLTREVGRRLGRRILLVGSMFRPRVGADLAVVEQLDHRTVLPLCAAAVHHGGAGTTAAVLRAGVPSVICSVQADQPYWGRQLEALGLGVTAPFDRIDANRLERLLCRALEPEVVLRASAYGLRFREDGVLRAVRVIESMHTRARTALPSSATGGDAAVSRAHS